MDHPSSANGGWIIFRAPAGPCIARSSSLRTRRGTCTWVARLIAEAAIRDGWGDPAGWLRAAEWGGEPHRPAAVAELMTAAGFQNMRIEAAAGIASASLIIGRKPLGN